jgi:hypothetical protein
VRKREKLFTAKEHIEQKQIMLNKLHLLPCYIFCLLLLGFVVPNVKAFDYPSAPIEGEKNYFTIAENGQANCCLVIPLKYNRDEVAAAQMLQAYLKLVTGAGFRICKENQIPIALAQIHLGETEISLTTALELPLLEYGSSRLPNVNGYIVKTLNPTTLIIRGATPKATMLGTVGFLKRYLGIRRYWPGEPGGIGDVAPKNATLKLPQLEWLDWPYFMSRIMSGLDDRGPQGDLNKKVSFADFWRMNYTIPSNESYYKLMKAGEHADEPELFPLIDGKRYVPKYEPGKPDPNGWQPCVSNPRVSELMSNSIKDYFRANPDKFAINLAVNDGYGDCTCEKCRAMDAPKADLINRIGVCDRYIKFDNTVAETVAKEFPDKIIAFLSYGSMSNPPTTVKLNPMLMPVLCSSYNTFQMWDDWKKTGADKMGVYLYHNGLCFIMPKLDMHQSAKRIRYIVENGPACSFYQEFYGIYPLDGMVGYIEQEFIWDPRIKEDDLLNEYYDKFYGVAGKEMKSFYEMLEADYNAWLTKSGKPHLYGNDISSIIDSKSIKQFSVLSVETALKAQSCLDSALTLAKDDKLVSERVKIVKALFDFAVLGTRTYWARERMRNIEVESMADVDEITANARQAVDSGLALADYKFEVMEKPEIKAYENHDKGDTFYYDLQKGSVHPEVLSIISLAFGKLSGYLNKSMGADKTVDWWQNYQETEKHPVLLKLGETAAYDASGKQLDNMVKDPSYEERGQKQQSVKNGGQDGSRSYGGANVWCGAGSPMSCSLTDKDAHTGQYSIMFCLTQHAGVRENVSVKDGDCLRMSVWVKHNDYAGEYTVQAFPQGTQYLARSTVKVPWKPNEWQKVEIPAAVAPGTINVAFFVFVDKQTPDAQIWIDDFFIGKYPRLPDGNKKK